jgi:mRNA deadenylase 3'-5' endonuclease subunit Ccr4
MQAAMQIALRERELIQATESQGKGRPRQHAPDWNLPAAYPLPMAPAPLYPPNLPPHVFGSTGQAQSAARSNPKSAAASSSRAQPHGGYSTGRHASDQRADFRSGMAVDHHPSASSSSSGVKDGGSKSSYSGVLKTYSPKDGYGFIHSPALKEGFDRDIYIHKVNLPEGASCGCTLTFGLQFNAKGQPQARDVSIVLDEAEVSSLRPRELLLDFVFEEVKEPASESKSTHSAAKAVRICSWNVLAAAYATCKAFPDVEPSVFSWPRRRPPIAEALQRLNADVVCLQEADRPFEDLGLKEYDHVRAQRPDSRADGCIIAWKRGSMCFASKEVISFDQHIPSALHEDITDIEMARFRRGNVALIAELHPPNGQSFAVATAHLCWEADCEDVRQAQLRALLQALKPFSNRLHNRIVLCGDLNAMPGCASHALLTKQMTSVYSDLEALGTVTNSNASASSPVIVGKDGDEPKGEAGTVEAAGGVGFAGMLDYICFDPGGAKAVARLRLPGKEELRMKLGDSHGPNGPLPTLLCPSWPSDHLPVAADVSFPIAAMDWQ